jgi:hypothetical protein
VSTAATEILSHASKVRLIVLRAGLTAGVLDITAAFVVYGFFGAKPLRLLQRIASGLLGSRAFEGGFATALLGLLCHFVVAFGAAAVYFALSHGVHFMIQHAAVSGALYGVAVYFFMNRIVVPLSAIGRQPFSFKMMIVGLVIHILCVGLPISLTVRRFSG